MVQHTPSSEDSRLYEFCVLYPYPFGQKEEAALLKEIDGIFAEAGAKLVFKDPWGRRGLAYPIGGFTEGNFVVYYFEMDPSTLKEVDQALRITKGVLRHLVVKPPKGYEIVSYAKRYEEWQERKHVEDEQRVKDREADLQKRVVDKAKREAKRDAAKKPVVERKPVTPAGEEAVQKQLDKLLSSETIEL